MITREQFEAYEDVRNSGLTNMFDVNMVSVLSGAALGKGEVIEIIRNYEKLEEQFSGGGE